MVFSNSKYITVTLITVGHIFVYLVSLDVLPGLIGTIKKDCHLLVEVYFCSCVTCTSKTC